VHTLLSLYTDDAEKVNQGAAPSPISKKIWSIFRLCYGMKFIYH